MTAKLNTPYDGSARLFQIGLKPLDPAEWIDVDDKLPEYLREKERLTASVPDDVFAAEAGTEAAQTEVLTLLAEHLPARFPRIYRRHGSAIEIVPAGRHVALDTAGVPPLRIAAALVQEDLVLMRPGEAGWRLAAASLSFPSSWSLREKFGRPVDEVHRPVPGFGAGSRNAELIARMFDHLRPEMPVIRWNWSLYGDARLFHPETASPETRRFGVGPLAENIFLRVERQTLRRLPQSRDILFTIRIYVDSLQALEQHPDASAIATTLVNQLLTLSDEQLAYKGLTLERNRLAARLREIAER
jgi:dimethylamine monooxygenase subunit A